MSLADFFSAIFNNSRAAGASGKDPSAQIKSLGAEIRAAGEEKNRILAVLESMAEGVVVLDAKKEILLINTVLAKTLGVSKEGAVGRYFWEIFRDPIINEMFEKALGERASFRVEHSILLSERVFEVQISPVFAQSEFLGVIAVFHDITRLKELERMRTEFVANVSHELKTPLTSILGFIETLKEGAIEDRENRLHFLNIIEDHSRKLHQLIEDLLLLSREESMHEAPKAEKVDLVPVVGKLLQRFDRAIREKSIQVKADIHPKPLYLRAEPLALEQALSNLIDNAVKYSESGGLLEIKAFLDGEGAVIEVGDTGIGIPEGELARIFERFYRVDKSRTRDSGGTGLGLSIVKHIVERHGGRVSAAARSPKGTIFKLHWPPASNFIKSS